MIKKKIARIISEISNGFLTMILAPTIAIWSTTLGSKEKILFSLMYILAPIFPYIVYKKMGKISDYELTNRKERPLYFTTISVLFGIIHLILLAFGNDTLINVSLNIFVISSCINLVTFFWKISGHMTYSTILFITLIYLFPSPYLFLLFLFSPFIGWSRIVLEKHTLTQVTLGTLITLAISILIYWGF